MEDNIDKIVHDFYVKRKEELEKEIKMDIKTFIQMYIAIGYLEEQRLFSIDKIREYINCVYERDGIKEYHEEVFYLDLVNEAVIVLNQLTKEGILSIVYHSDFDGRYDQTEYRITNKVNYVDIIMNNYEYFEDMKKVFHGMQGGEKRYIKLYPSKK